MTELLSSENKDQHLPVLILSDGKPGHVNQSVAFAKLSGVPFEIRRVSYRKRWGKIASYLLASCNCLTSSLYNIDGDLPAVRAVVSAGTETYYANQVVSRQLGCQSITVMLPKGYGYNYDLIIAQQHDQPPQRSNILSLPVNLSYPEPDNLLERSGYNHSVALIIGGNSRHFHMSADRIEAQIKQIKELFPAADLLVTTSRRTPEAVEKIILNMPFQYRVIASREDINPIADFLAVSDYVFVTEDSTSMISEAVSFGQAGVELLPLDSVGSKTKISQMSAYLEQNGYLHRFDGTLGNCRRKIDLKTLVKGAWL